MTKTALHKFSAITPLMLAALATGLVVVVLRTGWERDLPDEGLAAHLFQTLTAAQVLLIAVFGATAAPASKARTAWFIALQLGALAIPLTLAAWAGL